MDDDLRTDSEAVHRVNPVKIYAVDTELLQSLRETHTKQGVIVTAALALAARFAELKNGALEGF